MKEEKAHDVAMKMSKTNPDTILSVIKTKDGYEVKPDRLLKTYDAVTDRFFNGKKI